MSNAAAWNPSRSIGFQLAHAQCLACLDIRQTMFHSSLRIQKGSGLAAKEAMKIYAHVLRLRLLRPIVFAQCLASSPATSLGHVYDLATFH